MNISVLFLFSIILLSFPFVYIFSEWKSWIAFAVGVLLLLMIIKEKIGKREDK